MSDDEENVKITVKEDAGVSKLRKVDLIVNEALFYKPHKKTGKQLRRTVLDSPWDLHAEPGEPGDFLVPISPIPTAGARRLREMTHGAEEVARMRAKEMLEFKQLAPPLQDIALGQVHGSRETIMCKQARMWWGPLFLEYIELPEAEDRTKWKKKNVARFWKNFVDYHPNNRVFSAPDGPPAYEHKFHTMIGTRVQSFRKKMKDMGDPLKFKPNPTLDRLLAGDNRYKTCWERWHHDTHDPAVDELHDVLRAEYSKHFPDGDLGTNCVHLLQEAKRTTFYMRAKEAEAGGDPGFVERWEELARADEPITAEERFRYRGSLVQSASYVGSQVSYLSDVTCIQIFIGDFGKGSPHVKIIQHGGLAEDSLVSDDPESDWVRFFWPRLSEHAAKSLKVSREEVTLGVAHANLAPPEAEPPKEPTEKTEPTPITLCPLSTGAKGAKAKATALNEFFKENFAIVRGVNRIPWETVALKPEQYVRGAPRVEEKAIYQGKEIMVTKVIELRSFVRMEPQNVSHWYAYLLRCLKGEEPEDNVFAFVGAKKSVYRLTAPGTASESINSGEAGPSKKAKGKDKEADSPRKKDGVKGRVVVDSPRKKAKGRKAGGSKKGKKKALDEDIEMLDVDVSSEDEEGASTTDEDTLDRKVVLRRSNRQSHLRTFGSAGEMQVGEGDSDEEDEFSAERERRKGEHDIELRVPRTHCTKRSPNASGIATTWASWSECLEWAPVVFNSDYAPAAVPNGHESCHLIMHDEATVWHGLLDNVLDFSLFLTPTDLPKIEGPLRVRIYTLLAAINDPTRALPLRAEFEDILKDNLSLVVGWLSAKLQSFILGGLHDLDGVLSMQLGGPRGAILVLRLCSFLRRYAPGVIDPQAFDRMTQDLAEKLALVVALRRSLGLSLLQTKGFKDFEDEYDPTSATSQATFTQFVEAWNATAIAMLSSILSMPPGDSRSYLLWATTPRLGFDTSPFAHCFAPDVAFEGLFRKTWRLKLADKRHQLMDQQAYIADVEFPNPSTGSSQAYLGLASLWDLLSVGVGAALVGMWFVDRRRGRGKRTWRDLAGGLTTKLTVLREAYQNSKSTSPSPSDSSETDKDQSNTGKGQSNTARGTSDNTMPALRRARAASDSSGPASRSGPKRATNDTRFGSGGAKPASSGAKPALNGTKPASEGAKTKPSPLKRVSFAAPGRGGTSDDQNPGGPPGPGPSPLPNLFPARGLPSGAAGSSTNIENQNGIDQPRPSTPPIDETADGPIDTATGEDEEGASKSVVPAKGKAKGMNKKTETGPVRRSTRNAANTSTETVQKTNDTTALGGRKRKDDAGADTTENGPAKRPRRKAA